MSKRPQIKQADGTLVDLPLDAETIKGKKIEDYVTLNTEQKITGSKAFTGQVGNTQSESGVYLGLDTNPGAPNANIAITSANSAAYIDMGKPNHDYDFRLIKWDGSNGNIAQMCYNTEDGGAYANITIPRVSGTLALTNDIPPIDNASGVQDIGWTHADMDTPRIATANRIAHWNGAYSGTASNLTYCVRGEIASTSDIPTLKTINGESIVGSGNIVIQGGGGSGDLSNYVTKDEGLSKDGTATLNAHSSNEFYTLVTASDIACINYSASTVPGKHTPSTYYFGNGTGASGMKSGVIYAGNIYQNDKQVANKDDIPSVGRIQLYDDGRSYSLDVSGFSYVEISMIYNDSPGKSLTFANTSATLYEDTIIDFRISLIDNTYIYIKDGNMWGGGSFSDRYFTLQLQGYNDSSTVTFIYRGYK